MTPSKKLRILNITGSLFQNVSGPYLSVKGTAESLSNIGHSIYILGSKDKKTDPNNPVSYNCGFYIKALNKIGPFSYHITPGIIKEIKALGNIDICIMQGVWLWNCLIASFYLKKRNIPYVVTIRGEFRDTALQISSFKKKVIRKIFINRYLKNASCLHVLNEIEYIKLREEGFENPIAIIPNGVLLPQCTFKEFKSDFPKLLFLGRFHPIKNLEHLIKAWDIVNMRLPTLKWKLILVGEGDIKYVNSLKLLISQLNLEDSVLFHPAVSGYEKEKIFLSSDAFILPSIGEGLPMAAIEAMSYGKPSILSDRCNLDIAFLKNAAIRCETSMESIADAIEKLISMEETERKILSENSYKLIQDNYTIESVAKKLEKLYYWIVNQDEENLSYVLKK